MHLKMSFANMMATGEMSARLELEHRYPLDVTYVAWSLNFSINVAFSVCCKTCSVTYCTGKQIHELPLSLNDRVHW